MGGSVAHKRFTPCYIMSTSWSIRNGLMVLERQIFLQKEGRYSVQHVLHYPTVPMKVHWGGKLRVPIHPLLVEWRSNYM